MVFFTKEGWNVDIAIIVTLTTSELAVTRTTLPLITTMATVTTIMMVIII